MRPELVERRGRAVRQHRFGAAGEDRGHVEAVPGQQLSRNEGVDAAVDPVKPSGDRALLRRPGTEAEGAELPKAHDRVLLRGERGQPCFQPRVAEKASSQVAFSANPVHPTMVAQPQARICNVFATTSDEYA